MKRIAVDTIVASGPVFYAGVKPHDDANVTLRAAGYDVRVIPKLPHKFPFMSRLVMWKKFVKATADIEPDDIVLVQYPLFFFSDFFNKKAMKRLCSRSHNVTALVHDIDALRGKRTIDATLLSMPSRVIYHSTLMAEFVTRSMSACRNSSLILNLFDYYSKAPVLTAKQLVPLKSIVAFAGNLEKSVFLAHLASLSPTIRWRLYGKETPRLDEITAPHVRYVDKFAPDDPSILEAGWGLVWDGDSIDSCNGVMGNYLRYNSPHKSSLYLSRGIPLIVWSQAALAPFVKEQKIGIAVDSLDEIPRAIRNVSSQDYLEMIDNTQRIAALLAKGHFLRRHLQ